MLAEFFLTPEVFCDSDEGLRDLQTCLFPFGNTPVALICQLGDHWKKAIVDKIVRIPNQNHQHLAMTLFEKVCEDIAVARPAGGNAPPDEPSWIRTAQQSHRVLELDGVVVSDNLPNPPNECTTLAEFVVPPFWEDYPNPRFIQRDVGAQESVLRPFCAFSDWIIVRMPQIRGGNEDEIVTVKQIIRLATNVPSGFRKSSIELHFPLDERLSRNPKRVMSSVLQELREVAEPNSEVMIKLLPTGSFVNREILGGEFAAVSSGESKMRARWLITMNHVAVGRRRDRDRERDDANSWNLYSRHKADERLKELSEVTPLLTESV